MKLDQKSLLLTWKILKNFVNTFTAYGNSSVLNTQYLKYLIHVQLFHKHKNVLTFFSEFFKSRLNFEHIQKMMTLIASVFPILCTSENVVRETPKEDRFRVPFDKQHGKWAEALLKSERRHLYHIY